MVAALKHRHRLYGFEQAFAAQVGIAAGGAEVELQTQFTVRPNTHQLQGIGIGHSVNQDQIWFDVTVTMIGPFARQRMVTVFWRQGLVDNQEFEYIQQCAIEHQPVLTLGFSFVVALELTCSLNRPHSSQP
jgi:hypothetical protein